jgi:hypothetical protein
VLSNGCPYGAVQAIWAQDAQLISIDIIEGVVTLADTKSRDFCRVLSGIEPRRKIQSNGGRMQDDSAGAHLALFLGSLDRSVPNSECPAPSFTYYEQSPKVSAVVDMFVPTDLTQPAIYSWVQNLWLFNMRPYTADPNDYRNASPVFAVSNQTAPTCIVQGTTDTIVPLSQAIELRNKLSSFGVPYKWIPFYGGHEFSGVQSWLRKIIDTETLQCISGYLHPNPLNAF